MSGKMPHQKLWLVVAAAIALVVIVLVCLFAGTRSTEDLIDDLGSKNSSRMKPAFQRLAEAGHEGLPKLLHAYKESAGATQRRMIVRIIMRMYTGGNQAMLAPALIELLEVEEELLLRKEITGGLKVVTGRAHLIDDPLGDDADAWRLWWQEKQEGQGNGRKGER